MEIPYKECIDLKPQFSYKFNIKFDFNLYIVYI